MSPSRSVAERLGMSFENLFDGVINVIQNKLRSIIMVLSIAALSFPLGCAVPDMNQPVDTNDNGTPADGDGSSVEPGDGSDSGTDPVDADADGSDTPASDDDANGDSAPGDTDPTPGDDPTEPDADTDPDTDTDTDTDDDGSAPGDGTQDPGNTGGDTGGGTSTATVTANLVLEGPDGSRVEMTPLLPSLFETGSTATDVAVTPGTSGFVTFLCEDTISLGDVSFFDGAGGVITLDDVTFDLGTDFECGQTVTVFFSLPADVSLIAP